MKTCTKCKRTRMDKYIVLRKTYGGKKKYRCRARSVCASIARRNNIDLGKDR
jgi:hypothetical protein